MVVINMQLMKKLIALNLHGNDEKLLKDSLVEFHKDLTILVFNDKDINIPPANHMAFPKIISIVV